jgi:hypothetical protein
MKKADMVNPLGGILSEVASFTVKRREIQGGEWVPWFRGEPEANSQTALVPKLYRPPLRVGQLLHEEQELRIDFKRWATQMPIEHYPQSHGEWYFLMQYYGVPTRLLDWTDGALVALYFAVRDRDVEQERREGRKRGDAVVYVLDPWWLNQRLYRKARGKKLRGFSGVTLPDWPHARPYLPQDELDSESLKGGLLPLAIDPLHVSRRAAAQRSRFTILGRRKDGLSSLLGPKSVGLHAIPVKESEIPGVQLHLRISGISETTIFLDFDALGKDLTFWWKLRCREAS